MSVSSLLPDLKSQIHTSFPEVKQKLNDCKTVDEMGKVYAIHVADALDAPGALTKDKVQEFKNNIDLLFPPEVLEEKRKDPSSIFAHVNDLNLALYCMEHPDATFRVIGSSKKPLLIGFQKENGDAVRLGIFKGGSNASEKDIIRERLGYLIDKNNVPPTFIIDTTRFGKGSFQFYINQSTPLGGVYKTLSANSLDSSHVRSLAFSEIRRMNTDPSIDNMLMCSDGKTFKFIDGEENFPSATKGHKISCLFICDGFRRHLATPFSQSELSYIEQIDIDATCALLHKHQLDDKAIKLHRCALLLLKQVIPFNQRATRSDGCFSSLFKRRAPMGEQSITLEDLLVMTNITNPNAISFFHKERQKEGYVYGTGTMFRAITESPENLISRNINLLFKIIIHLKNVQSKPVNYPSILPNQYGHRADDSPTLSAIYDYYHDKPKALFFSYFRKTDGSDDL